MRWAQILFKFFSSLRLAVTLIVVLGIAFAVGTLIESHHGAHAAQVLIYRTKWLAALFFFLALNLFASAFDRIPWKKKHIGFLTTHLGIILMLMGALVTQAFGIEGQVQIQEGGTEARMTLADPLLHVVEINSGQRWTFEMNQHVFPWSGREKLHAEFATPFHLYLLRDYPKAERNELVQKTENGSPALHLALKGSMASVEDWLFLDHPEKSVIHLGPATVRFSREPIEIHEEKKTSEWGALKFDFENGTALEIPLDFKSAGKTLPLNGTPFQIKVSRILKDAVVNGNELVERSNEWQNPAIQLMLEGKGLSEKHTVFSKFPEFPTLHGMKPSEAHVRIAYDVPQVASGTEENEIRFILQAKDKKEKRGTDYSLSPFFLRYQVKKGSELKEGQVELGKETETGWMDFKFVVDTYYEHAVIEESYLPLPNISEDVGALSVIQVEVGKGTEKKMVWLSQGEMVHAALSGSDFHLIYGLKTRPLGFQVELKDFMMDTDPGTERPASFKSQVILKDPMRGIEREHLIQMNEPLKYNGFKLYQSAYHVEPGKPDTSIFTAAKDPGNPLKYTGAIVMVVGILMLFYTKQFSTLKGSDPKLRSK
ncbi:MAG: cytochrome c biogenesis protein ResB [Candidatus Omnitrophica bacterium]|nr:cytochrome c biogenesis protein ResB [Candidatus Omnitrophota bacterium]